MIIPVNDLSRHFRPLYDQLSSDARRVIESGWYVMGPSATAFEAAFAQYCQVDHCAGCANGTDALELALRACGAGPGKNVATVANAGGYSTTAILATGAHPVYVDIHASTLLVDTELLRSAITDRTAAVIVTHLYGRMADMPAVLAAAAGVPVIEDCAQAHGARLHGRPAGSWGMFGCFSFYPTKNLGALGDGGAVVTRDAAMAARIRELRQYGWTEKYRNGTPGGRNSRLDELQAALLLRQLPLLDYWNRSRRNIADCYRSKLNGSSVLLPPPGGEEFVAHLYVVQTDQRELLRERLRAAGVGSDVHYPVPDHLQTAWAAEDWARPSLPVTEAACGRVLTLPCFPELTEEEIAAVGAAVLASAGEQ